ncbi:MAG: radical SAM protein [Spirochaetes bacterium]|nr:radical SAM protein [Spirochaetota bacterium]
MKILLISSNQHKQMIPVIPIGLCWVAEALKQKGHKLYFLDLMFVTDCESKVKAIIETFLPDIIGIGIRNIDDCNLFFFLKHIKNKIIEPVKAKFSGPIIIGGSAVGISGAEILEYLNLEYAVRGDGERSLVQFVDDWQDDQSLSHVPGLMICKNGVLTQNNPPAFMDNYEQMIFPKVSDYIDVKKYLDHASSVQIQAKRGCALKCSYCSYNKIEGTAYRFRQPETIADDIEKLYKESKIDYFEFTDSAFNIPLEHAKSVLRAIIKRKLPIKLGTPDLNPGAIDKELVDLMALAGFKGLSISVESGSDRVLRNLAKGFSYKDILKSAEILQQRAKNSELELSWSFLLGAPNESKETLAETYDCIQKISRSDQSVFIATGIRVYKGTPLANQLEKENIEISENQYLTPVLLEPKQISLDEINEITQQWAKKHPNILLINDLLDEEKMELYHFRMNILKMMN